MKYRVFWNDKMWYSGDFKNPLHQFMVAMDGTCWAWNPVGHGLFLGTAMDDAIVMFWTGLQDDSENDIYEGDILDYGDFTAVVVLYQGSYMVECREVTLSILMDRSRKVIGNIHENKE